MKIADANGQDIPITSWQRFSEDTSLHGFKNISDKSRPWAIRWLWAVVVLGSFIGFIYTSVELILIVNRHAVKTVFKVNQNKSLEFPTLTFCSMCPLNILRHANSTQQLQNLMMADSTWLTLRGNLTSLNVNVAVSFLRALAYKSPKLIGDTFLQMRWNGEYLEPSAFLRVMSLPDRLCFEFNGAKYQSKNGSFVSDIGGTNAGLEIIADIHQHGCPGGIYDAAGLQMYILSPNDRVPPRSPDLIISPGFITFIALQKSQTQFLPYPYKAIGDQYCLDVSSPEYKNYSKIYCLEVCVMAKLEEICGCASWDEFDEKDIPKAVCEDLNAVTKCWIENQVALVHLAEKGELCDCPDPCLRNEFQTQLSFAYFPNQANIERLVELGKIPNEQYARQNLMKFVINYKDMTTHIINYIPEYNVIEILGTIGGQMGLFLGASVITSTEIIEAMLLYCYFRIRKLFLP